MDDPDVLVIGGGVAGLFCAHFLRQAGGSVTVVERGPVGGPQSCSAGNTGFVGTHGAAPLAAPGMLRMLLAPDGPLYVRPRWDAGLVRWLWHFRRAAANPAAFPVLLELKRQSYEILRKLSVAGELADTFVTPGMIVAYRDPGAFERARRTAKATAERGVPLRILDPGSVAELEPDVEFDICGAIYNEEGAYLRVPAFLTELAGSLADAGVDVRSHTEVVDFEVAGRAVRRVHTTRGDFRPGQVVLAAGAWSAGVAKRLDLGLLLQPIRGHAATVRGVAPRRPVTLGEEQVALAPMASGIRIGGSRELVGLDRTATPARATAMLRAAGRYLPALRDARPGEVWSGLRPCSPDSLPFIGRAGRFDNLHVACGHGHIGMGLAPAGGRLLAQLVAGGRTDIDPAPFRVGRYSTEDSHGT
jgi:D-amino-acid dehydrogenase